MSEDNFWAFMDPFIERKKEWRELAEYEREHGPLFSPPIRVQPSEESERLNKILGSPEDAVASMYIRKKLKPTTSTTTTPARVDVQQHYAEENARSKSHLIPGRNIMGQTDNKTYESEDAIPCSSRYDIINKKREHGERVRDIMNRYMPFETATDNERRHSSYAGYKRPYAAQGVSQYDATNAARFKLDSSSGERSYKQAHRYSGRVDTDWHEPLSANDVHFANDSRSRESAAARGTRARVWNTLHDMHLESSSTHRYMADDGNINTSRNILQYEDERPHAIPSGIERAGLRERNHQSAPTSATVHNAADQNHDVEQNEHKN